MNKTFITLLLLIISCSPSTDRITEKDLRDSNISSDLLEEGFVKEISVMSGNEESIFYDKIRKNGNEIAFTRYDQNLKIVREDIMKIMPDKWILKDRQLLNNNNELTSVEIIQPEVISFNPRDIQTTSEIQYNPSKDISISIKSDVNLIGKEKKQFQGKEIASIKYGVETDIEIRDNLNNSVIQKSNMSGLSYFGNGLGFVSMTNRENERNVEYIVTSILSLDEFEKKL